MRPIALKHWTIEQRLLARQKIVPGPLTTPCWEWTGSKNHLGYGQIHFGGSQCKVHRLAYQCWREPIPLCLELDHLCRNRACFNPEHLEPVTRIVNMSRGKFLRAEKTHCSQGHPYDGENLRIALVTRGGIEREHRKCRTCNREQQQWFRKRLVTLEL
jgi:hypothetical protein